MSFVVTTARILVGSILLVLGITCALRCAKEIASLPPERAADIVTDIVLIGLGAVGLRMLTSLLPRDKQDSAIPGTMPTAGLRSFARKTIGFVLVLLATALFVGGLRDLPQNRSAEWIGEIIGATILPLIMGYVGTKMMFRGDLPAATSPSPPAAST